MKRIIILLLAFFLLYSCCIADESDEYIEGYIICKPNDYINMRENPTKQSNVIGYLYAGYRVYLDGKQKNGFMHCVNVGLEMNEGWVHKGYIVYDEPEFINQKATVISAGRLAVRNCVNGKRIRWLKPYTSVKVYYMSADWSITNYGFVKSEYLEIEGE